MHVILGADKYIFLTSVREHVFYVFFTCQKTRLFTFFEMTCLKVIKMSLAKV